MTKLSDDELDELVQTVRTHVRAGYLSFSEIEERADVTAEDFETELPTGELEAQIRISLSAEIASLKQEESNWPVLTDYDRLRVAFDKLEDQGIVARENFTCCGTCGRSEIGDETDDLKARFGKVRGYVFFHQQDTESAVAGRGLFFNYGAFDAPNEAAEVAIGQALADALQSAGLSVEWNGQLDTRVATLLNWQRRWTGGDA